MRKILSIVVITSLCILVCQSCTNSGSETQKNPMTEKEKLVQEIKQLEDTLKANAEQKINRKLANDLIEKSKTFARVFPEDELSPAYLFRAGNVAVGIGSFEEAVNLFKNIHQNYTNYERAPDALFLQGFTYENHMNDLENAKICYDDFLNRFPEDQLADQVRVVLENIGKSPEELVKGFQNK